MKSYILLLLLLFISPFIYSEEIEIIFNKNYYPFEFINDEGNPDGFTIDLLYAIAREAALSISFIDSEWKSWESMLFKGKTELVPHYESKNDNNEYVINSNPLFSVNFSLLVRKNLEIAKLNNLKGKTLLLSTGDSSFKAISSMNFSSNIISTPVWSDSIKNLSPGSGDFTIVTAVHNEILDKELIDSTREINTFKLNIPYSIAAAKWNKTLIDSINNGISIVKASGEFDNIYRKWFGNSENLIIKRYDPFAVVRLYTIIPAFFAVLIFLLIRRKKIWLYFKK